MGSSGRSKAALPKAFKLHTEQIAVHVLTAAKLRAIVADRPNGFGDEPETYHSDAIFLMGISATKAMAAFDPRDGRRHGLAGQGRHLLAAAERPADKEPPGQDRGQPALQVDDDPQLDDDDEAGEPHRGLSALPDSHAGQAGRRDLGQRRGEPPGDEEHEGDEHDDIDRRGNATTSLHIRREFRCSGHRSTPAAARPSAPSAGMVACPGTGRLGPDGARPSGLRGLSSRRYAAIAHRGEQGPSPPRASPRTSSAGLHSEE